MNQFLVKLDSFFSDLFLKKAPQLSEDTKKKLAKAVGWVVLVLGLLSLPGIIRVLGINSTFMPWNIGGRIYARWIVGYVFTIIQVGLGLAAVPHLLKLKIKGWQLLYWAMLVGLLSGLLQLSGLSLLISFVFLYFLYQIRKLYTK